MKITFIKAPFERLAVNGKVFDFQPELIGNQSYRIFFYACDFSVLSVQSFGDRVAEYGDVGIAAPGFRRAARVVAFMFQESPSCVRSESLLWTNPSALGALPCILPICTASCLVCSLLSYGVIVSGICPCHVHSIHKVPYLISHLMFDIHPPTCSEFCFVGDTAFDIHPPTCAIFYFAGDSEPVMRPQIYIAH